MACVSCQSGSPCGGTSYKESGCTSCSAGSCNSCGGCGGECGGCGTCGGCGDSCAKSCSTTCSGSCGSRCSGSCSGGCSGDCERACKNNCGSGCVAETMEAVYNALQEIASKNQRMLLAEDINNLTTLIENQVDRRKKEVISMGLQVSGEKIYISVIEKIINNLENLEF